MAKIVLIGNKHFKYFILRAKSEQLTV